MVASRSTKKTPDAAQPPQEQAFPGAIARAYTAYLDAEAVERQAREIFLPKAERLRLLRNTPTAPLVSVENIAELARQQAQRHQEIVQLEHEVLLLEQLVQAQQATVQQAKQSWGQLRVQAQQLKERLPGLTQGLQRSIVAEQQVRHEAQRLIDAAGERRAQWEREIAETEAHVQQLEGLPLP